MNNFKNFNHLLQSCHPIGVCILEYVGDQSNRYRDIAVFRFSRWRPSVVLDFRKYGILTAEIGRRGLKCVIVPNFATIGQTVTEISRFSIFNMAAVRHLGL